MTALFQPRVKKWPVDEISLPWIIHAGKSTNSIVMLFDQEFEMLLEKPRKKWETGKEYHPMVSHKNPKYSIIIITII